MISCLLIRRAKTTTRDNGTYELEMTYGAYGAYGLPDKIIFDETHVLFAKKRTPVSVAVGAVFN